MKDTPDEIASVMNLILPEDEQLPVKAEFLDEFFRNRTDKNSVFQFINKRKERELKFEDILHYQKIIVALTETDRIMKEIDKIEIE